MKGYVYAFGVRGANRVKIGFSRTPAQRCRALRKQYAMPEGEMLFALQCSRYVESMAHSLLWRERENEYAEWFAVDAVRAMETILAASRERRSWMEIRKTRPRYPLRSVKMKAAWVERRARYGPSGGATGQRTMGASL